MARKFELGLNTQEEKAIDESLDALSKRARSSAITFQKEKKLIITDSFPFEIANCVVPRKQTGWTERRDSVSVR